jgi:uncharacterized repeat protein (TIGR01451 family)
MKRTGMWLLAAMMSAGTLALSGLSGCANDSAKQARHDPSDWNDRFPDPETVRVRDRRDDTPPPPKAPAKVADAPKPPPPKAMGCSGVIYIPTGDRASSGLSVEKSWPCEMQAGQEFTFDICATNITSGMSLSDVVVIDESPANLKIVKTEPSIATGQQMTWNVGTLAPGEKKCLKVTAVATAAGTVTNCWTGRYSLSQCITMNVTNPALKVTKTMPAEVMLCDNIPVTIEVTNTGTGVARDVKVSDKLPTGLKMASGQGEFSGDAGSLAAGQSRKFDFMVKADKTGTYSNAATAMAAGNLNATTTAVTTKVTQPVLTLKAECPGTILIGRQAAFKLTVGNTGDAACSNTTVTVPLPAGTQFVSAGQGGTGSATGITWNVGAVKPGESKTLDFTLRSTSGVGNITINATANCGCSNPATATCATGVQGTADIGTLLDDDNGVVLVGDNHDYRYEVVNQGQIDLTNVKVVITLPEGLEFVSSTAPKPPQVDGRKLTFTGVTGVLKPGQKGAYILTCKASTPGEKLVISETTADQIKTPVRDDELTNFVPR